LFQGVDPGDIHNIEDRSFEIENCGFVPLLDGKEDQRFVRLR
jgi:hypothetical protein